MTLTDKVSTGVALIGGIAIIGMFCSIIYDVFMRYFFNRPTRWAVDLGELLMLPVIYLAAALVLREDGHIRVDILISRIRGRLRVTIEFILLLLGIIWGVVIAWMGWVDFFDFWERGRTTDSGHLPMAPWVLFIGLGGTLLVIVFIIKITERASQLIRQSKDAKTTEKSHGG